MEDPSQLTGGGCNLKGFLGNFMCSEFRTDSDAGGYCSEWNCHKVH